MNYSLNLSKIETEKTQEHETKSVKVSNNKSDTLEEDDEKEVATTAELSIEAIEDINLINPSDKRKLAYKFFALPPHMQLGIALELNLVEDEDRSLSEVKMLQTFFKRAEEQELLGELWEKVMEKSNNPFK